MMHTLHCYFKSGAGVLKQQDKQLLDPNRPLSSIIPAEAIQYTNNATANRSSQLVGFLLHDQLPQPPKYSYISYHSFNQKQHITHGAEPPLNANALTCLYVRRINF